MSDSTTMAETETEAPETQNVYIRVPVRSTRRHGGIEIPIRTELPANTALENQPPAEHNGTMGNHALFMIPELTPLTSVEYHLWKLTIRAYVPDPTKRDFVNIEFIAHSPDTKCVDANQELWLPFNIATDVPATEVFAVTQKYLLGLLTSDSALDAAINLAVNPIADAATRQTVHGLILKAILELHDESALAGVGRTFYPRDMLMTRAHVLDNSYDVAGLLSALPWSFFCEGKVQFFGQNNSHHMFAPASYRNQFFENYAAVTEMYYTLDQGVASSKVDARIFEHAATTFWIVPVYAEGDRDNPFMTLAKNQNSFDEVFAWVVADTESFRADLDLWRQRCIYRPKLDPNFAEGSREHFMADLQYQIALCNVIRGLNRNSGFAVYSVDHVEYYRILRRVYGVLAQDTMAAAAMVLESGLIESEAKHEIQNGRIPVVHYNGYPQ